MSCLTSFFGSCEEEPMGGEVGAGAWKSRVNRSFSGAFGGAGATGAAGAG